MTPYTSCEFYTTQHQHVHKGWISSMCTHISNCWLQLFSASTEKTLTIISQTQWAAYYMLGRICHLNGVMATNTHLQHLLALSCHPKCWGTVEIKTQVTSSIRMKTISERNANKIQLQSSLEAEQSPIVILQKLRGKLNLYCVQLGEVSGPEVCINRLLQHPTAGLAVFAL